jgi:3-methyladenine DNA glycosylase AlkD
MPDRVQEVRRRIAAVADPERAPAMQAYMRSAMPFRGVPAPLLRRTCRSVFDTSPLPDRAAWEAAVRTLWDGAEYREERYAALQLAAHRRYRQFLTPSTLDLHRHLVLTGRWWDFVDTVAHQVGAVLDAYPEETGPVVSAWAVDGDLWLRRTAILCQLGRKERTDTALLARVLTANLEGSTHGREFFIRKAIGWALREHAKTDAVWVQEYVEAHADRLSGLSRREALKHVGT